MRHLIFILLLYSPLCWADSYTLPIWTEKTSWKQGPYLMVTGVATGAKSQEEGRTQAFDNSLEEFKRNVPGFNEALVPETQRTIIQKESDGTFTVYRLMKLDLTKIKEVQEHPEQPTAKPDVPCHKDHYITPYPNWGPLLVRDPC